MDATVADPLVGRLLDGRYEVGERLAGGGMATVYAGIDTRLDRPVAIKVMHPALADDADFVRRFHREALAVARLSSPYVVSVYDEGIEADCTANRTVFLVMELVRGRTLRHLLHERGRLFPYEALAIGEALAAALAAAHAAGVVHRDVKPENVLLADDGQIKVADFGLARAAEAAPVTAAAGVLMGTVGYLAPEQVAAGLVDARSDVYATGVVLFEMLTGRPPFGGDNPLAVAYQHVHGDVPPPSSVAPDVPPALDDLVRFATARDPMARPADGRVLLAALRRARAALSPPSGSPPVKPTQALPFAGTPIGPDGDVPTQPPGAPSAGRSAQRMRRQPRRSVRMGLAALALVLIAGVLTAGAGWWLRTSTKMRVPTLVGLDRQAAERALAGAHLKTGYAAPIYNDIVAKDIVVSSSPAAGMRIDRDATVRLKLSLGPQRIPVPSLAGQSVDDAKAALVAAHLGLAGQTQTFDDTVPSGHVVRSEPPAGSMVAPEVKVTLIVSTGAAPVQLPDVSGDDPDQATSTLQQLGLTVQRGQAFSDTETGKVARTDPGAGTTVHRGDPVTLVVSQGQQLVSVPSVRGRSVRAAVRILRENGFDVRVIAVPGLDSRVIGTNPAQDSQQPKGSTITIFAV